MQPGRLGIETNVDGRILNVLENETDSSDTDFQGSVARLKAGDCITHISGRLFSTELLEEASTYSQIYSLAFNRYQPVSASGTIVSETGSIES